MRLRNYLTKLNRHLEPQDLGAGGKSPIVRTELNGAPLDEELLEDDDGWGSYVCQKGLGKSTPVLRNSLLSTTELLLCQYILTNRGIQKEKRKAMREL